MRSTEALRELTSSLEAFLARTYLLQDVGPDSPASTPVYGSRWLTPFAYFDHDSSSSRTSPDSQPRLVPVQASLLSEPSSPIWPRQVTWDRQFVYELPMSWLPTSGSESSSLLPTPAANDDGKSPEAHLAMKSRMEGGERKAITSLAVLARADFDQPLLPTPGAHDFNGGEGQTRELRMEEGETGSPQLRDIAHLLPTPQAHDAKVPVNRESWERKMERKRGGPRNLSEITRHELLPTPAARDLKGPHMEDRQGGPSLGSALSGDATSQPSDAGSPSSDDTHHDQLTIEVD